MLHVQQTECYSDTGCMTIMELKKKYPPFSFIYIVYCHGTPIGNNIFIVVCTFANLSYLFDRLKLLALSGFLSYIGFVFALLLAHSFF